MKTTDTSLFPFPHFNKNQKNDGSILSWPEDCCKCRDFTCKKAIGTDISICSRGYNYQRVDNNIVIAGILIRDFPATSSARKKRIRHEQKTLVTMEMIKSSIERLKVNSNDSLDEIKKQKEKIIEEYVRTEQYKPDFLEPLRMDIKKGLSFVHDYKQINTQIAQNINVIIETKYKGENLEDKLSQATEEEKAIYYSSKMLDEKLNVAKFLIHPEWIDRREECVKFSFHGLVIKYRRIYTPKFLNKKLKVKVIGKSYHDVVALPQAVSVIPHTFIDNAAKYSPKNGRIQIVVQDTEESIDFSVSSYGPKITKSEIHKIFDPFYRTHDARLMEEEGAGYGLYISQFIAKNHLGSIITVSQNETDIFEKCHWTKFSIKVPLKANTVI